jgi:hypothetical protein
VGCGSCYGDDNVDLAPHEVGGDRSGTLAALLGGMVLDEDVSALRVPEFA